MKRFYCLCGQEIFLNNLFCDACGRDLAYDPTVGTMWSGELTDDGFDAHAPNHQHLKFQHCANRFYPVNCNWLLTAENQQKGCQCLACQTTRTVPDLSQYKNPQRWRELERAKRHLFTTLINLKLPIESYKEKQNGLVFDFLEDKRSNPSVSIDHVLTGHSHGVITLNAAEADEGFLHMMKEDMGEQYRTLLGHFRHEIGHYYWSILLNTEQKRIGFRDLFGDERTDYDAALKKYYQQKSPQFKSHQFISLYASSHPLEDWAETWAHYLHIVDTLETAVNYGISAYEPKINDFNSWYSEWARVAQVMNALNRSMGHHDAYPFILNSVVKNKLKFIDQVIDDVWKH